MFRGYSTMITSLNSLVDDIESDLKKLKKRAKNIKQVVGLTND